jgi:hypothetical protein
MDLHDLGVHLPARGLGGDVTYLPAPYESPQQDDLSATLSAILTTTVGLITSWVIGQHAYPALKEYVDGAMGNLSSAQQDALTASVDTVLVPTIGWAVAAVLMVIGSLLLLFRRGRGLLVFGALVAIATTAWAQFGLGYGADGATIQVSQWPLYWGGVAVLVLAMLPPTNRWLGRGTKIPQQSTVIGTTETGAILWPGM